MDKKELRQYLREKLAQLPAEEAAIYDARITDNFLNSQHFMPATRIAFYIPLKGEVSCLPILKTLVKKGHIPCLPVVVSRETPLIFRQYLPGDELRRGISGPQEPLPHAREIIPDVVVIPMLGFTRDKYRLGYGSGFYDRTLGELRRMKSVRTIGLAYDAQEVEDISVEPHDVRLDVVITNREIIT